MKDNFSIIREALKKETGKYPRYFTRKFYADYIAAVSAFKENRSAGIDTSYRKPGAEHVLLFSEYNPVYNSAFYQKDGCTYCLFLEKFYSMTA